MYTKKYALPSKKKQTLREQIIYVQREFCIERPTLIDMP